MKHILLCGDSGAGKSTLIARLLAECPLPVGGFFTKKEALDASGYHPIYLHPAGRPMEARVYTQENRVGSCDRRIHDVCPEVFDRLGVQYLAQAPAGCLLVMDELGFMESRAPLFTQAVLARMDGDGPILAAVKSRGDTPFLNALRTHPRAELIAIDESNRDALYDLLAPRIRALGDG